ncbi:methyltransferase domain-containing protein [Microseira sp. BLCC-F43]|jgi:predicted SAM-dependent methyltransferase|uniref:class I SAM-dependent methyltransferase n=1 Tax=Microseira sp. BLCC-F43 TaxID=3153602 RepID=UPI0035B6CE1B
MNPIKLHIGGKQPHPDWKILDIQERPEVNFVCNANCLQQFEDNSIEAIYASHVLEHFHYSLNDELSKTLREWYRVLQPGGKLFISVPDLRVLCWLYLNPNLSLIERHYLMAVMFGGQNDEHDVHKAGFDFDILTFYLEKAGFQECTQVEEFGIFDDNSSYRILDTLISLNALATK